MPPELGPFLWTKKTRLANHSKLIGGASDPARLESKVDGSFDLDDRGHSPFGAAPFLRGIVLTERTI